MTRASDLRLVKEFATSELGVIEKSADGGEALPGRYQFLAEADLANLQPPRWLVSNLLPAAGLTFLVGKPGSGKTFAALDLACTVATGREWWGRRVECGAVVYVCAEGAAGLPRRLEVWKGYHGVEQTGVLFVPQAVPFRDLLAVEHFVGELARRCTPALVVFDTLPRCMAGAKETSHEDMSLALAAAGRIIEETAAAVLFVTHPAIDGERPRGHGSQDAGADAILVLEEEGDDRVLKCTKMKDAIEPDPIRMRLVALLDSALLVPAEMGGVAPALTRVRRVVLETIRAVDAGTGVPAGIITDSCKLSKGSVYRALKELSDAGFAKEARSRWGVTATGLAMLASVKVASVAPESHSESHTGNGTESRISRAPLHRGRTATASRDVPA